MARLAAVVLAIRPTPPPLRDSVRMVSVIDEAASLTTELIRLALHYRCVTPDVTLVPPRRLVSMILTGTLSIPLLKLLMVTPVVLIENPLLKLVQMFDRLPRTLTPIPLLETLVTVGAANRVVVVVESRSCATYHFFRRRW